MGQSVAVKRVAQAIQNGALSLTTPNKPKGSYMFLGPTGVGKTETVNLLTDYLYGGGVKSKQLIRLDMSEYSSIESREGIIGNARGYKGKLGEGLDASGGQGFILLDEMEKGHVTNVDICLQMLDAARITCGGQLYNLENYYIVFTSNIGALKLSQMTRQMNEKQIEKIIRQEFLAMGYRPEFLNRFTDIIVYNFIETNIARTIALYMLNKEVQRLCQVTGCHLSYGEEIIENVVLFGYERANGARPMKTYVEKLLQGALRDYLLHVGKAPKIGKFMLNIESNSVDLMQIG